MNDDTERRLRDALRAGDLPAAPATVRASLRAIADGPVPVGRRRSRLWARALPAMAAVVAVAVVGAVAWGVGRNGPGASSTGLASSGPSGVVSPPAGTPASSAVTAPVSSALPSASLEPDPTPIPVAHVYAPAELEALLAKDRASMVGTALLVRGDIDLSVKTTCTLGRADCPFGILAGTSEVVMATRYTGQLLQPKEAWTSAGVLALKVRDTGLEYLGFMGEAASGFRASLAELQAATTKSYVGPVTFAVDAWLVASPPVPCPMQPTPAPADTPFANCPWAWLTPREEQPTTTGSNAMSMTPPADGVAVQWSAYGEFAPKPISAPIPEPRFGTYLVRLVVDTRQGADGPRGWQVVARLAP